MRETKNGVEEGWKKRGRSRKNILVEVVSMKKGKRKMWKGKKCRWRIKGG